MNDLSIQTLENTAEWYQKLLVPALFEKYASKIISEVKPEPHARVLDVACGTGIVACKAAEHLGLEGSVGGLDLNPGMLKVAAKRAPEIEWRHGKAEELDWEDEHFDVVVSQFALMFFEDRQQVLNEMVRVLKPGGQIVISVFDSLESITAYRLMTEIFGRIAGKEVVQALTLPFSLGNVYDLQSICEKSGLNSAQISHCEIKANFPDIRTMVLADVKGWFPLAGITLNDDQIEKIVREAKPALSEFVMKDGSIEFPLPALFIKYTKN